MSPNRWWQLDGSYYCPNQNRGHFTSMCADRLCPGVRDTTWDRDKWRGCWCDRLSAQADVVFWSRRHDDSVYARPLAYVALLCFSSLFTVNSLVCLLLYLDWVVLVVYSGYVSPRSCWPKSAVVDRQRCSSYAAVMPDSPLPAAVNKRYRVIYGHNWRTQ